MIITDKIWGYILLMVFSVFMFKVGVSFSSEPPKPGEIIGPDNIEKYKEYLPCTYLVKCIKERNHTLKLMEKPIQLHPPKEMLEATKKYALSCKLTPEGGLTQYVAGFPFLEEEIRMESPLESGLKVAWNMTQRCFGDDYHTDPRYSKESPWEPIYKRSEDAPGCRRLCIDKNGKIIISDQMAYTTKCIGRVHTDPKPIIPGREEVLRARYYKTLNPRDVAGQQILLLEYLDASKNDDLWLFVPSIRRVKRMPTSQRSATRPPTDYNWDESWGWGGKVVNFNWKLLGEQKVLAGLNTAEIDAPSDNNSWPDNPEMFLVDCYVVEMTPKDPSYANPRKMWYIDKTTYFPVYSTVYNKAGEEWRNIRGNYQIYKRKGGSDLLTSHNNFIWCDLLSGHKTFMYIRIIPDVAGVDPQRYTVQYMYEASRGQK